MNPPGAPVDGALVRRIARETSLFAALQVASAVLVWASTLALARLLDQSAFGVYAIGTFFLGLGALLGDGGLGAALLRKKSAVTEEEYRVTVTFLLALGGAMGLTFVAAMPLIASRFHLAPGDAAVLRAMAPLFLMGGLRAVPYIRMERELRFGDIARVELLATLCRQLAALALAWAFGGAWALAGAQLAGALAQLALAYRASPGAPALEWNPPVLRRLLGYGLRVQALAMAAFLKDNVSAVLLGTLLGPHAVGVFDFGVKYAQLPVTAVNALGRVQLPAYARFATDDPELHRAVEAVTRTALLAGGAILVTLAAGATSIIPYVYAPRWLEAVPVVWGLSANMAGGLVAGPLFALLQAQGRAGLALSAFAVWTAATWACVLAVRAEGLGAIALAYSLATVVMTVWLVAWASRHLAKPLWGAYVGPVTAGVVAVVAARTAWRIPGLEASAHDGWRAAGVALVAYVATLMFVEGRRVGRDVAALAGALRRRR